MQKRGGRTIKIQEENGKVEKRAKVKPKGRREIYLGGNEFHGTSG